MTEDKTAKACTRDARISRKQAIEIANFIRGKKVADARNLLLAVLQKKIAVPFKKFNRDMGHKPNIAAGRYPENSTKVFLGLLNSVEKNAIDKNLSSSDLFISELRVNKGSNQMHYGRQRGTAQKRAHIDIAVKEMAKKKAPKKEVKEQAPKDQPKKEEIKKEAPKKIDTKKEKPEEKKQ